jgi:hypothetical protein
VNDCKEKKLGTNLWTVKKQPNDTGKSRFSQRGFFGWLVGLSITAMWASVLTAIVGCSIQLRSQAKIKMPATLIGIPGDFPLNTGKVVTIGSRSIIGANTQAAGLKAFSASCTHEGCVVGWNKGGGFIIPWARKAIEKADK